MKVLLLTGVGALFFAYYWADNFDPGKCPGWEREELGGLSDARPQADDPCSLPASLQGARVLLTGASAGVGEELAYRYARLGSHLVLTAHTEALLQKVRSHSGCNGGGGSGVGLNPCKDPGFLCNFRQVAEPL